MSFVKRSLFREIIAGTSWNMFGQVASQIISLGTLAILTRILNPEDFGLVAMSYVVTSLAYIFASMGIGSAVIQRKEIDNAYLCTAFWTNLLSGFLVAVAASACAPMISWFFGKPELAWVVTASSAIFALGGMCSTHRDLLERGMQFKSLSIIDLFGNCMGSVTAVIMALHGMSYWSLVAQQIAAAAVKVPFLWKSSAWCPRLLFDRNRFNDLFGFSSYVLLSNLLNFFNRNGDNILIGKFLGASQLGLYDLAYTLMLKPLQYVSHTASKALYPALSRIQDNKAEVREIYLQSLKLISLITFPMMTGLAILAPDVIRVLYGDRWQQTVPVLQMLCFVGMWQSIGTTVGLIFLSQDRPSLAFKMTLIGSPITWLAFLIGCQYGIEGVAFCYAIASAIWYIFSQYIANRTILLKVKPLLQALAPAIIGSLLMSLSLLVLIKGIDHFNMVTLLRIFVLCITGIFVYSLFVFFLFNNELLTLLHNLKSSRSTD